LCLIWHSINIQQIFHILVNDLIIQNYINKSKIIKAYLKKNVIIICVDRWRWNEAQIKEIREYEVFNIEKSSKIGTKQIFELLNELKDDNS